MKKGIMLKGVPHIQFLDKEFLKVMENSEIDYLIWYTPYKKIDLDSKGNFFDLPKVAIYSRSAMDFKCTTYDYDRIISVEE